MKREDWAGKGTVAMDGGEAEGEWRGVGRLKGRWEDADENERMVRRF